MFAVRNDLELRRIDTALEAVDKVQHVLRDAEGVFAGRLLTTTPSRVTEG
jgi:hypothetical protein